MAAGRRGKRDARSVSPQILVRHDPPEQIFPRFKITAVRQRNDFHFCSPLISRGGRSVATGMVGGGVGGTIKAAPPLPKLVATCHLKSKKL